MDYSKTVRLPDEHDWLVGVNGISNGRDWYKEFKVSALDIGGALQQVETPVKSIGGQIMFITREDV